MSDNPFLASLSSDEAAGGNPFDGEAGGSPEKVEIGMDMQGEAAVVGCPILAAQIRAAALEGNRKAAAKEAQKAEKGLVIDAEPGDIIFNDSWHVYPASIGLPSSGQQASGKSAANAEPSADGGHCGAQHALNDDAERRQRRAEEEHASQRGDITGSGQGDETSDALWRQGANERHQEEIAAAAKKDAEWREAANRKHEEEMRGYSR